MQLESTIRTLPIIVRSIAEFRIAVLVKLGQPPLGVWKINHSHKPLSIYEMSRAGPGAVAPAWTRSGEIKSDQGSAPSHLSEGRTE